MVLQAIRRNWGVSQDTLEGLEVLKPTSQTGEMTQSGPRSIDHRLCLWCGKPFLRMRETHRYCSHRHAVAAAGRAYRKREREVRAVIRLEFDRALDADLALQARLAQTIMREHPKGS